MTLSLVGTRETEKHGDFSSHLKSISVQEKLKRGLFLSEIASSFFFSYLIFPPDHAKAALTEPLILLVILFIWNVRSAIILW